ncbi:short-chain dehydrogenase [Siphonobacter sp. BAB-5385]|uniref:SDR family oxidoreductase n=1 Tax=Siphonobacter sp. BAB-5385 TaxID=1864822 RepID=UPI000B9E216D|nr:SDR family NAD(P)-dependent oxidoreductase [Siphonobacter sp. BAB-5385]OZI05498.1 short-chain dehydrogenase [Siphonobacter sp. BAB-5385]
MNLTQQTILITGATSGIGLHLAGRLHQMGNQVIACGRNQQQLDQLAAEHAGISTYLGDITDEQQRQELADWATTHYPTLNIVINNAGIMQQVDLTQPIDPAKVMTELVTNLLAPIHLGGLFVKHLQEQSVAALVNVSSGLAFTPLASVPVYCATKAAMHSFSVSQRHQLRDTSVRVFEIIPPAVGTNLGHQDNYDNSKDQLMPMDDFINAVIDALQTDTYEAAIGAAEYLRQQRDAVFSQINP